MLAQEMGGDIVYISSKNSLFAGPNNVAYGAAKADQAHQVRLLAAELGEHGIRVNGVNPDGVVRGSGIFAGGWGAKRAAVYGVPEERARRVLRPAHPAQARGAARARRQRRVRADRRGAVAHDRAARAGRRRRRGGVPAMTTVAAVDLGASSGRVMLARVGAGRLELDEAHRFPNEPVRDPRHAALGRARAAPRRARRPAGGRPRRRRARRRSASTPGRSTTACSTPTGRCWATRCTTATAAPTACWPRCSPTCRPPTCTGRPGCSCCRSTRSSSSWRPRATPSSRRPAGSCSSRTCSRTGSPASSGPRSPTPRPPSCSTCAPATGRPT